MTRLAFVAKPHTKLLLRYNARARARRHVFANKTRNFTGKLVICQRVRRFRISTRNTSDIRATESPRQKKKKRKNVKFFQSSIWMNVSHVSKYYNCCSSFFLYAYLHMSHLQRQSLSLSEFFIFRENSRSLLSRPRRRSDAMKRKSRSVEYFSIRTFCIFTYFPPINLSRLFSPRTDV